MSMDGIAELSVPEIFPDYFRESEKTVVCFSLICSTVTAALDLMSL